MKENNFFDKKYGKESSGISMQKEVLKPEPTDAQKLAIWQELKAQEEIFKQDQSIIFNNYK